MYLSSGTALVQSQTITRTVDVASTCQMAISNGEPASGGDQHDVLPIAQILLFGMNSIN